MTEKWVSHLDWSLLEQDGRPFFVYSLQGLEERRFSLTEALLSINRESRMIYSVKSNPHPAILQRLKRAGWGFGVSSESQTRLCRDLEISQNRLYLSGLAKSDADLAAGIRAEVGTIHLASIEEFATARELRVQNFTYRIVSPHGGTMKLGFTPSELEDVLAHSLARAQGLHIYLGRYGFSPAALRAAIDQLTSLIDRFSNAFVTNPRLFVGLGFASTVAPEHLKIDFKSKLPIDFEIGRGLVGAIGTYFAPVLSRKSRAPQGDILILNGGLQHLSGPFLAAPPVAVNSSGAASSMGAAYRHGGLLRAADNIEFCITGSLCLAHDVLHPRLSLPSDMGRGDWISFNNAGAYGLTSGVSSFIGQDRPREFIWDGGRLTEESVQHFHLYHKSFTI